MGADYLSMTLDSTAKTRVQREFARRAGAEPSLAAFRNTLGVVIRSETFPSIQAAEEYVMQEAERWGPAIAVKVKQPETPAFTYIGAWVSA